MSTSPVHSRPFSALLAPLIGAGALALVVGCQSVVPSAPPTPATTTTTTTAATIVRTIELDASDFAFSAPETLPAGLTTIRMRNHGQEIHHGQLLRMNDGVSFEQFAAALQAEGEGALRLISAEGGPGTIDPHAVTEVTLDLKPGTYALACFIPGPDGVPHLAKGMLKPLQVTAPSQPQATPPQVQGTFSLRDFAFDMPASLASGKATYRVVNVGRQLHELNIVKLASGKSIDDLLAWEKAPAGPPPFESVGGINAFSADGSGYMTLDLAPGTYVALCRVPDPASGVAHEHLGMIQQFTIRG